MISAPFPSFGRLARISMEELHIVRISKLMADLQLLESSSRTLISPVTEQHRVLERRLHTAHTVVCVHVMSCDYKLASRICGRAEASTYPKSFT
jgi:hypothetical protein